MWIFVLSKHVNIWCPPLWLSISPQFSYPMPSIWFMPLNAGFFLFKIKYKQIHFLNAYIQLDFFSEISQVNEIFFVFLFSSCFNEEPKIYGRKCKFKRTDSSDGAVQTTGSRKITCGRSVVHRDVSLSVWLESTLQYSYSQSSGQRT